MARVNADIYFAVCRQQHNRGGGVGCCTATVDELKLKLYANAITLVQHFVTLWPTRMDLRVGRLAVS